jgi:hypothetical protein
MLVSRTAEADTLFHSQTKVYCSSLSVIMYRPLPAGLPLHKGIMIDASKDTLDRFVPAE